MRTCALEWANTGYDLTQDSESGMTNIAFAQELVACCLYSAGKTEDEVADLILKYIAL